MKTHLDKVLIFTVIVFTTLITACDNIGESVTNKPENTEVETLTLGLSLNDSSADVRPSQIRTGQVARQDGTATIFQNCAEFEADQFVEGKTYYVEGRHGIDRIIIAGNAKGFNIVSKNVQVSLGGADVDVNITVTNVDELGIPTTPFDFTPAVSGASQSTVTGTPFILVSGANYYRL